MKVLTSSLVKKAWNIVRAFNKEAKLLADKQNKLRENAKINRKRYVEGLDGKDYSIDCYEQLRMLSNYRKRLFDLAERLSNKIKSITSQPKWECDDGFYFWLLKQEVKVYVKK